MLVLPIFCVLNSILALYFFSEYLHIPTAQLSTIFYRPTPLLTARPSAVPLYPLPALDLYYLDYLHTIDSYHEVCSTHQHLLDQAEKHHHFRTVQETLFSEVIHFDGFIRTDQGESLAPYALSGSHSSIISISCDRLLQNLRRSPESEHPYNYGCLPRHYICPYCRHYCLCLHETKTSVCGIRN